MYLVLVSVLIIFILFYFLYPNQYETFSEKGSVLNGEYNLLTNGSFQNGNDIENSLKDGDATIVRIDRNPNCDISQYVLRLGKDGIYNIYSNVRPLYNYKLTFWTTNTNKDLIKISSNNIQIDINENMFINKKKLNDKTWYLQYVTITTPSNANKILIKLSNKTNSNIYYTDVKLLPYLKYLTNFEATIGLETFLDANNKYSCSDGTNIIWNDLSNNGFTYKWTSKPVWSGEYFSTKNNTLIGPSSMDVLNTSDEFTIIVHAKSNSSPNNLVYGTNSLLIPGSPGSIGTAIRLDIPNNYGKISLTINGKTLMRDDDKSILPSNDNIYTITYKNGIAKIWINDILFQTYSNVVRPYFSKYPIKLNSPVNLLGDKKKELPRWDANLYSFMIYSRSINQNEIEYINYYLRHHPNPKPLKVEKPDETKPIGLEKVEKIRKIKSISTCPSVRIENGEYIVYIPQNSKYSQKMGHGEHSYGSNKETVHHIYKSNFPDCHIPKLLRFDRIPHNVCPYIVAEDNPCSTPECKNVDWTKDNIHRMGMTENCRRNVSHYCHKNRYIDPKCKCWKDSHKYNLECQKMRREYEPPEDYGFTINVFDIEEHPDLKNYVRKDKIPCWNCNLTAPVGDNIIRTRNWKDIKSFE